MKKCCSIICLLFLLSLSVSGQSPKVIKWLWDDSRIPFIEYGDRQTKPSNIMALQIVEIKVENQSVMIDQPFSAGDDWFKQMSVRVKNILKMPISSISMGFRFAPPNGILGKTRGFVMYCENKTKKNDFSGDCSKPVVPNGETVLYLTKQQFDFIEKAKLLDRIMFGANENSLWINDIRVTFKDGTKWGSSRLPVSGSQNLKN